MKWYVRLSFSLLTVCIIFLFSSSLLTKFVVNFMNEELGLQPNGFVLQPPSFVKAVYAQAGTDFLSNEAGISAYVNIEQPINFTSLKKALKGSIPIEEETNEYMTAIVKPVGYEKYPELEEYANVRLYIHKDGWIVAYLPKQVPAAMIIDFVNYEQQKMSNTTLSSVIAVITGALKIDKAQVNYYDFSHPEATNVQLITDVERSENFNKEADDFSIEIPSSLTVLEMSWMHVAYHIDESYLSLDDTKLSSFKQCSGCWKINYGYLDETSLASDENHQFILYNDSYGGSFTKTQVGLAILYKR